MRPFPEAEKSFTNYFPSIESSKQLFEAARDNGIYNIINISSRSVYDDTIPVPYSEDGPTAPLNYYGAAKLAVEDTARIFNHKYGMKIKSLRLGPVFGLGDRPGYIPMVFLEKCLRHEKLSVYGKGQAGKEYVYVKDIVRAILTAIEKKDLNGIYNIGTGILTTNRELAETYCRVFDNPQGYELLVDKPEIVTRYYMNVEKAKRELGYETIYSLEQGLQDMKKMLNM